jgi:hypothetical protein
VRIGVTGHVHLTPETVRHVAESLHAHLTAVRQSTGAQPGAMVGVSCLAPGADSLFAQVLLALGGRLEVILPSADYRESMFGPDDVPAFDELLSRAAAVSIAQHPTADAEAFAAANETMLGTINYLVAVWDGLHCARVGGTAHTVRAALSRGIPVMVIWPEGSRRARLDSDP